jgi:hypothetical protein
LNFFCLAGVSADMPYTSVPVFEIFLNASRNPHASIVQPGVSALGKKNSTTSFPRNDFSDTGCSFSSGNVNSGAFEPSLIAMIVPSKNRLKKITGWAVTGSVDANVK